MAMVHTVLTRAITGTEYRASQSSRLSSRKVSVRAGGVVNFDPDKRVWKSQPVVLRSGRTIWVAVSELDRSIDASHEEVRRQFLGGRSRRRDDDVEFRDPRPAGRRTAEQREALMARLLATGRAVAVPLPPRGRDRRRMHRHPAHDYSHPATRKHRRSR